MHIPKTIVYEYGGVALEFPNHGMTGNDLATIGREDEDCSDPYVWQSKDQEEFNEIKKLHAFLNCDDHKNIWWWYNEDSDTMDTLWRTNERWVRDCRFKSRYVRYRLSVLRNATPEQKATYGTNRKQFNKMYSKLTKWLKQNSAVGDHFECVDLTFLNGHDKIACFARNCRFWSHIEHVRNPHCVKGDCCALVLSDGTQMPFSLSKQKHDGGRSLFVAKQVQLVKSMLGVIGRSNERDFEKFLKGQTARKLQTAIDTADGKELLATFKQKQSAPRRSLLPPQEQHV